MIIKMYCTETSRVILTTKEVIFTTPEAAYQRRLELEKEIIPPELRKNTKNKIKTLS